MLNMDLSTSDPRPEHWDPNDPLHIKGFIGQKRVKCVYINNGRWVNIIYEQCVQRLPIEWKKYIQPPHQGLLVGFTGHGIWPEGTIMLLFILVSHDRAEQITRVPDTIDGSAAVVATRPDNEHSTHLEIRQEIRSCQSESFKKVENQWWTSAVVEILANKSRERCRDVLRQLTTSQSWKKANTDPMKIHPEHRAKIARRGNAYLWAGASIQPAINGQATLRKRMIRDLNQLFASLEDKQNPFRMKKSRASNNTDSNDASITLTFMIHYRKEQSKVSDKNNKTPNSRVKCKTAWRAEKSKRCFHPVKGRRS
ncbi:unnamed protein product [Lactuca saligna]|uniref:Uncharacterized protein n=1 Tax=Lactuca saligna TaxID=75948 RepID=A0AA35Z8U0_LACSI|nr:unnamed protein product [Lactuca saligna]